MEKSFSEVFEVLFLATYRTSAMNKLSIKKLLWSAVVWHPVDVTYPYDFLLCALECKCWVY